MTTIRDDDSGSPSSELLDELTRVRRQCETLALRKDELEVVLAAARLGFCRIDSGTRALVANSQFKVEFGWAPDEPIEWRSLEERLTLEDRAKLADAVQSAFTNGGDIDLVVRSAWPDGSTQWVALRGRIANEVGERTLLILTSRNISSERQAAAQESAQRTASIEHERKLRADAEAANRGKDQFLSVFSHELRSPLNAILGWNRILMLKRAGDAEVASITARVERSARAQLKMVNDLLDLGRIETGKLKIEPRPLQLAKVVGAALDLARPSAVTKAIAIVADLEPGAGAFRGDPDRLQQVVTNLLSNAVKFTPSGGEIVVGLRTVAGFTELVVSDTGQGIASELLPHVFDRFKQGDDSSTRQYGGLGLGLALVREIVTLHGGSVAVSSEGVGKGAAFVVRFPVRQSWKSADAGCSRASKPGAATASLGGLSILVVDDEPDARTVVAETLRLEGARVTVSDSASAAFAKVQEVGAHFDIIVTDIGMPEEDGYSLVRRLRTLQSCRQMLAIAVTGYASKSDVDAAMNAGFDLHVPKPLEFDTFVPLVRRLANGAVAQEGKQA
jgi:signal transduction histidine kinase/ActR/RegA family two-component response regulator